MSATEQYFPAVLFTMLYKVVLPCESVDEILKCNNNMKGMEVLMYFLVMLFVMFPCSQSPTWQLTDEKTSSLVEILYRILQYRIF